MLHGSQQLLLSSAACMAIEAAASASSTTERIKQRAQKLYEMYMCNTVYISTTSFTGVTTRIEIGQSLHPESHMTSRLLSMTNLNPEVLQCAA